MLQLEPMKDVAQRMIVSLVHFGLGQNELVRAVYRLTIYGLAQCLPILSAKDCVECMPHGVG
jgi:hypothetical protein